jgi:alcohol dehydrogenase YqhD (iron-dependent ADH family)
VENFTFYNPTKVVFGKGVIPSIAEIMKKDGVQKVLLVYGMGALKKNGVYDSLIEACGAQGIQISELSGVKPNPLVSKVREGVESIKKSPVDAVLGVGGGSAIDTAKIVAAGFFHEGDAWDFYGKKVPITKALPVYTVLTTSATGTEMNQMAVLTHDDEKLKFGIGADALYPRVTVIDPSVQASLPLEQSRNGGIDTIAHALEVYFDGTKDVALPQRYCESIVATVVDLLPALLKDPSDYQLRAQIAWCSTNALNNTTAAGHAGRGDMASHRISYGPSGLFDTPHGASLSVIMPAWMSYVYKEDVGTFAGFARRLFESAESSDEKAALDGIEKLRSFFRSLGAPTTLRELGIGEESIEPMSRLVATACPIGFLKKLYIDDIRAIYKIAY